MKAYKVRDAVGRVWEVPQSAVFDDYVEALMQMYNLVREEAQAKIKERGEKALEIWWREQVSPYTDLVMSYGRMVEDISREEKERLINFIAAGGYMEEVE